MLINGLTRAQIMQRYAKIAEDDQTFDLKTRAIDADIAAAQKAIIATHETNIEYHASKHARRLDALYARSMQIQDFRTAHQVARTAAEFYGLNAPTRQQVTGENGGDLRVLVEIVASKGVAPPPNDEADDA